MYGHVHTHNDHTLQINVSLSLNNTKRKKKRIIKTSLSQASKYRPIPSQTFTLLLGTHPARTNHNNRLDYHRPPDSLQTRS